MRITQCGRYFHKFVRALYGPCFVLATGAFDGKENRHNPHVCKLFNCCGVTCAPPPNSSVEVLTPVPQNVTLLGDRVITEVTKLKS